MKYRTLFVSASAFLCAVSMHAQTGYEAVDFTQTELNGTARFVGMGGAMGALGGDISTIATNPAGLGLFRRADVMITAGFDDKRVKMGGVTEGVTKARLNNAGFVVPFQMEDVGALKFINIGFNYQRRNSFYKNMTLDGLILANGVSQMNQMRYQAQDGYDFGVNPDDLVPSENNNPFWNERIGWLSLMGYNPYVIDFDADREQYVPNRDLIGNNRYSDFYAREKGGIDQSDINVSFNFNDRVYLGATVGFYDVDYTKNTEYTESYYSEVDRMNLGYTLYSDNWIHGEGVDFKLGVIVRPFEYSSFRIGAAVHTPVFYRLTLSTGTEIATQLYNNQNEFVEINDASYNNLGGNGVMDRDFKLRTPWLFNLSTGYTIGSDVALGLEYEYEDHSTTKLKDYEGYDLSFENGQNKAILRGTHTLRMGAEIKIVPGVSLRVGYNYISSAFEKTAYKELVFNSLSTNTDFTNKQSTNVVTAGAGIKITRDLYLDMAYKYYGQKGEFRSFDDPNLGPTKLDYTNHSFLATLGYRF